MSDDTRTALETMLDAMSHKCRIVDDDDTCFMGTGAQLADAIIAALADAGYTIAGPGQVCVDPFAAEWIEVPASEMVVVDRERWERLNEQNAALQRNCDRQFADAANQMIVDARQRADIDALIRYAVMVYSEFRSAKSQPVWNEIVEPIIERYREKS